MGFPGCCSLCYGYPAARTWVFSGTRGSATCFCKSQLALPRHAVPALGYSACNISRHPEPCSGDKNQTACTAAHCHWAGGKCGPPPPPAGSTPARAVRWAARLAGVARAGRRARRVPVRRVTPPAHILPNSLVSNSPKYLQRMITNALPEQVHARSVPPLPD